MNSASTVFGAAPTNITLTLSWIDVLLAKDSDVARAALEDKDFTAELTDLNRAVEQRAFEKAEAALDVIVERFALVQAIAFRSRCKS